MTEIDRQEAEAAVLERSGQLQAAVLAVLNQPGERWHAQPTIVAHALAETLGRVLSFVVLHDPTRRDWTADLLAHVADLVDLTHAAATAEETRH